MKYIRKIHEYGGYTLKSGLEKTMCELLSEANIKFDYEERVFEVSESFIFSNESYEKYLNGKGEFKDRGGREINSMTYTPDFTSKKGSPLKFVIETKGRSTPEFSMRWKLFKKSLDDERIVLFMPRTKANCIKVIEIIKKKNLHI